MSLCGLPRLALRRPGRPPWAGGPRRRSVAGATRALGHTGPSRMGCLGTTTPTAGTASASVVLAPTSGSIRGAARLGRDRRITGMARSVVRLADDLARPAVGLGRATGGDP